MKTISIGVNAPTKDLVKSIAEREGISSKQLLRTALTNFLLCYFMDGKNLNISSEYEIKIIKK